MRSSAPFRASLLAAVLLAVLDASAQNLVKNGDFSAGNVGFTSDYAYAADATDCLFPATTYTLARNTTSPYVVNTYGTTSYSEHTTGNGLMMAVNGSTTFNSLVWSQTLTGLVVGQTYRFSVWTSRWTPNGTADGAPAAKLQAVIGSTLIASFLDTDTETSGVWTQRLGTFTATTTSAPLQIRDLEYAAYGNDFALDDIAVQATPEPSALAALSLGAVALLRRRRR